MLERIAVSSFFWQRKGKGTDALRVILQEEQAKRDSLVEDGGNSQQIVIQFKTQEEQNVRFYSLLLGFSVDSDQDFCKENPEHGVHSWHMTHDAENWGTLRKSANMVSGANRLV